MSAQAVPQRAGGAGRVRIGAVLAVLAAAAFVGWLVLGGGDDDGGDAPPAGTAQSGSGPAAVSPGQLSSFAARLGHPVYWAGPRDARTYELTRTRSGRVFVRYLPSAVRPGVREGEYLTVATYPQGNGYAAVATTGKKKGARSRRLGGGGLVVADGPRARSAFLAQRGAPVQVEVFHPAPGRAYRLAATGAIEPVR